jgi:hypothetical protein
MAKDPWDEFDPEYKFGKDGDSSIHLGAIFKWSMILAAACVTLLLITSSSNILSSIIFAIIIWSIGIFLWRRRKSLSEWNAQEVPLKDFIVAKKQEEEARQQREFDSLMDNRNANLSPTEEEKWNSIIDSLNTSSPEPAKKKGRFRRRK